MHMADALLSPVVGGAMWAVSAATIAGSSARVGRQLDDRKVPLMGVLGAFIFAAQMINFSIPGTGSSGHLAGGLLLSILLGPCAAFLTIASVLVVQALFFADGGLLALGCNIVNMGFFPAFLVFPFIYKQAIGANPGKLRLSVVTMLSAVIALQLGAFAVVAETYLSGVSSVPFFKFLLLMQPIHLAIGLVEGLVTVAVISFVRTARPEMLQDARHADGDGKSRQRILAAVFLVAAVITAGLLSWFACKDPDGLEWSVARVTGAAGGEGAQEVVHRSLAKLQEKIAWFPDYTFKGAPGSRADREAAGENESDKLATSVAGMVGTLLTLIIVFLTGFILKRRNRLSVRPASSP